MKKIISWLGIALLFAVTNLNAQAIFQSYYQWANILNVDHGSYKKVKTWMSGGVPYYFAVGGATDPSGNGDMAILSCINGSTGAMVFTKIITQPFPTTETFEAVSVAVTENNSSTPIIAVLCNHTNAAGQTKMLLYQFDVNGLVTNALDLGFGKGIDVAHNPFSVPAFDVLSEVKGVGGTDYQLMAIDPLSFAVQFSNTYSWGANDKPTALVIDNGDMVAAGYTEVGLDRQIFMVRAAWFGFLIWGQAFGLPNRRETITDVVFYTNEDELYRYGFCGYDDRSGNALVGDVGIAGPSFGYTERYIPTVNNVRKPMRATAIARTSNMLFVSGMYDNVSPFIATFSKNANLTPLSFNFFDDQDTEKEELNDIYWNFSYPNVVSVGSQRRNQAWGVSPANQDYSWLITLSTAADATCETPANAQTLLYTSQNAAVLCQMDEGYPAVPFTGYANPTYFASLDNCITPMRMAGEEDAVAMEEAANRVFALYPNPGNGIFAIDGAIAENETAILRVTDMTGRLLREQNLIAGTTKQFIDLAELSDGIYSVSVTIDGVPIRIEQLVIAH